LFIISPCFNLLFPRLRVILCKQYLGHVTTKYTWIIVYAKENFIFVICCSTNKTADTFKYANNFK
jgi:hypothetical protein